MCTSKLKLCLLGVQSSFYEFYIIRQKPGVKIENCLDYSQDPDHPMNEVI